MDAILGDRCYLISDIFSVNENVLVYLRYKSPPTHQTPVQTGKISFRKHLMFFSEHFRLSRYSPFSVDLNACVIVVNLNYVNDENVEMVC